MCRNKVGHKRIFDNTGKVRCKEGSGITHRKKLNFELPKTKFAFS